MVKKIIVSNLIACAVLAAVGLAQVTGNAPATPPATPPAAPQAQVKPLKEAYAGKFLIGMSADPSNYSAAEQANMKMHYDINTPENCMKPQPLQPSENNFNWATADALVKWCEDNNIKVWGHTLLWHSQTANWFFQGPNGQPASRELAMQRLEKHIKTVVGRYKGRVIGWDVANESIADGGNGQTENLRNMSWYRTVGPDVLTMAFKWAREADPDAQLFYNDYNIEQGAVQNRGKHASSMLLLKRLLAEGAPITGVGIQGHWHLTTNIPDVEQAIKNYASLGLKVSITELDVTATGSNSGAMPGGGGRGSISAENFQKQAEVYAKLFEIFLRHEKDVDRVTFWGISDRRSWRSSQQPLIFDAQMQPKPAFHAILEVASKPLPVR